MPANAPALPVTDDDAARLWPAVADLLSTAPEVWSTLEADGLTATQDRALYLLTAAGLIERRLGFRWQMASGEPDVIEATVTLTGESGLGFALKDIAAELARLTEERIEAGEYRGGRPYHFERTVPSEWRLSDMGALAKSDLGRATEFNVFDVVMRRGAYDGRPWKLPNGEIIRIDHIHGYGKADWRAVPAPAAVLPLVNVANWGEGADALTDPIVAKIQGIIDDAVANISKRQSGGATRRSRSAWLGEALVLRKDHPDWSDAKVAREAGVDRSTLCRDELYRLASATSGGQKDHIPTGHRKSGTGTVEAVAPAAPTRVVGEPVGGGSRLWWERCSECQEIIRVPKEQRGKNPLCEGCED